MEEERHGEPDRPARKITPLQLREQYGLNVAVLAHQAKVAPRVVYFMLLSYPVERQQAEQVLATVSTIAEQTYTLDNVQVALLPEKQEQEAPTAGAQPAEKESAE